MRVCSKLKVLLSSITEPCYSYLTIYGTYLHQPGKLVKVCWAPHHDFVVTLEVTCTRFKSYKHELKKV
jgi:hypothetical protein